MSVKGPRSPLSSGAESLEPLSPQDLQRAVKSDKFEAALAQLANQIEQGGQAEAAANPARSALGQIAGSADLNTPEGAFAAVRESARFLVKSRLQEKYKDTEQGEKASDELSEYVAQDPFLHRRVLGILQKLKPV
jgi:hypothetical protein